MFMQRNSERQFDCWRLLQLRKLLLLLLQLLLLLGDWAVPLLVPPLLVWRCFSALRKHVVYRWWNMIKHMQKNSSLVWEKFTFIQRKLHKSEKNTANRGCSLRFDWLDDIYRHPWFQVDQFGVQRTADATHIPYVQRFARFTLWNLKFRFAHGKSLFWIGNTSSKGLC